MAVLRDLAIGRSIWRIWVRTISTPRPPFALWLPAAIVAGVMVLPLIYLVIRTAGAGEQVWELLFRTRTLWVLGRTVALILLVTGASVGIALPLAWLTTRTDLPLRRSWAVITALPLVIPSFVAGFVVQVALGPRGMLQQLLEGPFGVTELPSIFGLPGAALTLTLLSYPYVLLPVQAQLRRINPALDDTSRSLGYGSFATFWQVTVPMLRPAVVAGALLVALYTLTDFGAVSLLRYETFTWAIFIQYESAFDRGIAAALSLVLVGLAAVILGAEAFTRRRARYYTVSPGAARRPSVAKLGWWKIPALGFLGLLVSASLVLPLAVLTFWLLRGLAAGETLGALWEPLRNSMYVAALAAVAAALGALPVATLLARYPGRFAWLLERASFTGFALPGIVVAIALVFFGVNFARPLYQTTALLVLAYVVLFFAAMLGPLRSSLLQISPRLEEAARTLGRTPVRALLAVTLPLAWPGIFAGAALVFLLTMKELPATLILGPIGFKTLATVTWSAASEAFFARAAAPALLTVLASAVPLAFLLQRRPRAEAAAGAGFRV